MKTGSLIKGLGLAMLVVVFLWSAQRALRTPTESAGPAGVTTIRFAHWQLEGGLREAFDHLAREYEKLHPGVRVEQVAVPERIFPQWLNTQLVGGTITDLVSLGLGSSDEMLARHFLPLSDFVDQPNPYNVGTPLEGVPLRETILDGLQGGHSYKPNLLEYYGVSMSMFTVRMYYNRDLWRTLLGDTPPPTDFDTFIKICERVRAHGTGTSASVIPVAGSTSNAPPIMERLFSSQTQRLALRLDLRRDLHSNPLQLAQHLGLDYLRGKWTLDDVELTRAMEINREAGLNFQPGYTQLGRDDAAFYFVQGRALMIATGSWDSPSFRKQADFEIGVFQIPIPGPDHPRYGAQLFGPAAENDIGTGLSFGVPRQGGNTERALDFLRFLSSRAANAEFSRRSAWLPSVEGIELPPEVAPFLPVQTGYVEGFHLGQFGADSMRLVTTEMNRLVARGGSVEQFREAIRAPLGDAIRADLGKVVRDSVLNISRQDVILQSLLEAADAPDAPESTSATKASQIIEAQNRNEAEAAWQTLQLRRTRNAP